MQGSVVQAEFNDFECFAEAIGDYDTRIKQLDSGRFRGGIQRISCGAVTINNFTATARLEALGGPPTGVLTFGIPTQRCESVVWRHLQSDANTIQIYRPNTELALITRPFFEAIDVSISEAELNRVCRLWEFPDIDSIIGNREMAICSEEDLRLLRSKLQSVCRVLAKYPKRLEYDTDLQETLTCEVPALIIATLVSSRTLESGIRSAPRNRLFRKALDYMRGNADRGVSVGTVCSEVGIGMRSLQREFRKCYDMTPKAYLQVQRLNDVYRELHGASPETTRIIDVASRQGFWHMSQLAADYRRLFGELPSATLNRTC